jgi:hypothetical protein
VRSRGYFSKWAGSRRGSSLIDPPSVGLDD